jgi:hypothetical protein
MKTEESSWALTAKIATTIYSLHFEYLLLTLFLLILSSILAAETV